MYDECLVCCVLQLGKELAYHRLGSFKHRYQLSVPQFLDLLNEGNTALPLCGGWLSQ